MSSYKTVVGRGLVRTTLLLIVAGLTLSGCSTFGIYESSFSCPAAYNGKCVSLDEAYRLSKEGRDDPKKDPEVAKKKIETLLLRNPGLVIPLVLSLSTGNPSIRDWMG